MKHSIRRLCLLLSLLLLLSACAAPASQGQGEEQQGENPSAPAENPVSEAPAQEEQPGFSFTLYGEAAAVGQSALPTDIPETAEEPALQLHYHRQNPAEYDSWGFWLWAQGGDGNLFALNYQDEFGGVAVYPFSKIGGDAINKGLGIIPRLNKEWKKDGDADRLLSAADLAVGEDNYCHIYILQGDLTLYTTEEEAKKAMEEQEYNVTAAFMDEMHIDITAGKPMVSVSLYAGETLVGSDQTEGASAARYTLKEGETLPLTGLKAVVAFADGRQMEKAVSIQKLYDTEAFDAAYYYDGELGALYTPESTTFKVWSPLSEKIELNLYTQGHGTETPETLPMEKGDKGVFSAVVEGDLSGRYYTYTVYNDTYPKGQEIVDPYAKSAGRSGRRGMVVNFAETDPEGWDDWSIYDYDRKELTVWETHVSDVTSSKTWTGTEAYRYKFLGLIEEGTTYTEDGVTVTTGFDHIKELGVNAVQLVPIFDQANEESIQVFNWGYNPLNYNVLEGSYSTNPADGYVRIREFKQTVQAFHEAGINVIMDVVYNHVSAAGGSNFDVLMPGYYFRYDENGALTNGSGCGNETASERSMCRKFILDSLTFWAEEYKLGGFRFDLMGLHDIETMNLAAETLEKVNPSIVLYGEPWTGGTSGLDNSRQAVQKNANELVGVGQFNDQMRDALIKGGLNAVSATGWVTDTEKISDADVEKILAGLQGVTAGNGYLISDPNKTLNYVTCHDNYTLYDRARRAGVRDKEVAKEMAVLANAVVFTSQGTTFMLAGEELLRTKGTGSSAGNSYDAGYAVNELDYSRKIQYPEVFEAYKGLIAFKQNTKSLHLEESEMAAYTVTAHEGGAVLEIGFEEDGKQYRIFHANGLVKTFTVDLTGYTLILDTLGTAELGEATALRPFESLIVCK